MRFRTASTSSAATASRAGSRPARSTCSSSPDSVDEIVRDVREALRFIPAENLILSSDCGFGRQGLSRLVAFHKAEALAQAAATVRADLP